MSYAAVSGHSNLSTHRGCSRTPLELVTMLYDGALRFMAVAREAIERWNIPARRDALSRTMAIVSEHEALNLQAGGDVAVNSIDSTNTQASVCSMPP